MASSGMVHWTCDRCSVEQVIDGAASPEGWTKVPHRVESTGYEQEEKVYYAEEDYCHTCTVELAEFRDRNDPRPSFLSEVCDYMTTRIREHGFNHDGGQDVARVDLDGGQILDMLREAPMPQPERR